MAIEAKQIISLVNLINNFNAAMWETLKRKCGVIYGNTGGTYNVATGGNTYSISISGRPIMPRNATIGVNVTRDGRFAGGVQNLSGSYKYAIPAGQMLNPSANLVNGFVLKAGDIGRVGDVVTAQTVYEACREVIRSLTYIRRFKVTWNHSGSSGFSQPYWYYGLFPPASNTSWIDTGRHGGLQGVGAAYYQWTGQTRPGAVAVADNEVPRYNCTSGQGLIASYMNGEINKFWSTWSNKCYDNGVNRFTYTYHTCHLNCHNSCYCHGSRHRR